MQVAVPDSEMSTCGVLRRLAAMTYDSTLLFAVLFFATIVAMIFFQPAELQASRVVYPMYLLLVIYLYFVWQWIYGRQTLGMKAWRVKLIRDDATVLNWQSASLRFVLALVSLIPLGFGLFWSVFDPDRATFYDRYSKTRLIRLH